MELAGSQVFADLSVVRFHCARSVSVEVVVGGEEMISSSPVTNRSDY